MRGRVPVRGRRQAEERFRNGRRAFEARVLRSLFGGYDRRRHEAEVRGDVSGRSDGYGRFEVGDTLS